MMKRAFFLSIASMVSASSVFAAQNLIPDGDFSRVEDRAGWCHCEAGKFSVFTEPSTWNRCGKLEISEIRKTAKGERFTSAILTIGTDPEKTWFDVAPGTSYAFSVDLKGDVGYVGVRIITWSGDEYWKDRSVVKLNADLRRVNVSDEWMACRGTFRAPEGARHAALQLTMARSEEYGEKIFSIGNHVLFDNVRVIVSPYNLSSLAAGAKVSVSPVPVTSDFELPFLPNEIFTPPTSVVVRAAVNERKSLPVAVANLTDRVEDYMVLLECGPEKFQGSFGLDGLPAGKVRVYKALRVRDAEGPSPTCRFDPLVSADGGISVSVPPKEAGLVWYDFDLRGVNPGIYSGRIRVIPLCEPGKFTHIRGRCNDLDYSGEMTVLPVRLEVLPFELPVRAKIPAGFFIPAVSESSMALAAELGTEWFNISPYLFKFAQDRSGDLVTDPSAPAFTNALEAVRRPLAWGKSCGVDPKFFVCYSVVSDFKSFYNPKGDLALEARLWPQFLRGMARVFAAAGVRFEDYALELYDEPPPDAYEEALRLMKQAKETVPEMRLGLTLGYRRMTVEQLKGLSAYADVWVVWKNHFNRPEYRDFFLGERSRGKDVRHYTCDTSTRVPLDGYYRKQAWFGEYYGLSANMLYQWCEMPGGVGTWDFKAKSKGSLVNFLYGEPVRTIRFMAYREGVTDIRYLTALEKAKGADPAIRQFLKSAAKRVIVHRPFDATVPDRIRDECVRVITERKKIKP